MKTLLPILADVRFTLRLLRRRPGFAITLLGILVAGIGATTAMFSVVISLLLRPLPFPEPEQLTLVNAVQPHVNPSPVSVPDFNDWRDGATTFETMAAVTYDAFSLSTPGTTPESVPGATVSGDFFPMFRLGALRGRLLGPDDDRVGGPKVAVLSARVWHRRFASDPSMVGKTVDLGSDAYTVVGIAPEGFRFSGPSSNGCDVWVPLAVGHDNYSRLATNEARGSHFLDVMGRRKPGVTVAQAQTQLTGIAAHIAETYPDSSTNVGVHVEDLHDGLVGQSRQSVWLLFGAVGLFFLVVCANVANLLLARAAGRRAEMAARVALGATPRRLVAQLVTETVVVFVLAALGGTLLAVYLVRTLGNQMLEGGALSIDLSVDWTALASSLGLATVAGLVFGLVPASEAYRVAPQAVLAETGARASLGRPARVARGALVIAQVALACALLVGSGLTARAYLALASTPLGFDPQNLATATVVLPPTKYSDEDKVSAFYRELLARVAALPAVESVAINTSIPMGSSNESGSFLVDGRPPWPAGARPLLERNTISPGYFKTLGIPILRGRDFDASDVKESRPVLIISKAAAEKYFPGEDPIGQRIDWGDTHGVDHLWREIVGVAGDVHRFGRRVPIAAESYAPLTQHARTWTTLVIRTDRVAGVLKEIPSLVAALDPQEAVASRQAMAERVADMIGPQRFTAQLLGTFSLAGLLLATLGIFGLVSYATTQRTRELGIRLALGSSPRGLVALVMRDGVRLLAAGLVLGLVGAVFAGRAIASRVAGAAAFDPVLSAFIVAALGVAGVLASLIPALRAARIPPAISLRHE
jgi:predicted permease